MGRTTTVSWEAGVTAFALFFALFVGVLVQDRYAMALIVPMVLAGGVLLLVRPVIGAFLLAGTIPVEAALMIEGATASRLIGMAVVGTWGTQKLFRREPLGPLVSPALIQISILLLALACLSLIWAEYPQGLQRRLFLLAQLIVLCILLCDLISSWDRITWVVKFVVLAASVAALLAAEQYFFGGARRAGRGVVGGINSTASMLVAILPFAFFLLRSHEARFWRWLGVAYIPLAAIGVAATMSRMNFLLFPLVIAVHVALMARTRGDRRKVLALGFAMVVGVSFLPMDAIHHRATSIVPYLATTVGRDDPGEGVSARGFHLRVSLAMFSDHPIRGVGYQNYQPHFLSYQARMLPGGSRFYQSPQHPHNSHFSLMATLGIGGLLLWAALFVIAGSYLLRTWRRVSDRGGAPPLMVQAITIALGIQFLFGFYREIHQSKIFWLVLALSLAVHRISVREDARWSAQETRPDPGQGSRRRMPVRSVPGAT